MSYFIFVTENHSSGYIDLSHETFSIVEDDSIFRTPIAKIKSLEIASIVMQSLQDEYGSDSEYHEDHVYFEILLENEISEKDQALIVTVFDNRESKRFVYWNDIANNLTIKATETFPELVQQDIFLKDNDITILMELKQLRPQLLGQEKIAAGVAMDRKTVGIRLKHLSELGLVECPQGKNSGATITSEGIEQLERIDPKDN